MEFTYHIGLHCTDEDRALSCLKANDDVLARHRSVAARPGRFRPALRKAMLSLKGAPAPRDVQEQILDAAIDDDAATHVLFSSDSFLCVPARAIVADSLYPLVGQRAPWIRNLFPEAAARFCLAIRNPATLIPALHARFAQEESAEDYLGRIDPDALSWADMVTRLREAVPDSEIVVWCNEDLALMWPDILRLLARLPEETPTLAEEDAFLDEVMQPGAAERLRAYISENPPRSPAHRRRITAAFLDRFAVEDAVADDVEAMPGWTEDRVAALTEAYEADIARIEGMDGVRLLLP